MNQEDYIAYTEGNITLFRLLTIIYGFTLLPSLLIYHEWDAFLIIIGFISFACAILSSITWYQFKFVADHDKIKIDKGLLMGEPYIIDPTTINGIYYYQIPNISLWGGGSHFLVPVKRKNWVKFDGSRSSHVLIITTPSTNYFIPCKDPQLIKEKLLKLYNLENPEFDTPDWIKNVIERKVRPHSVMWD